jgi:Transposase DDE domain
VLAYCYFTGCGHNVAAAEIIGTRFHLQEATRMLLTQPLQAFVENSPVSVMVAAIVERLYDPIALEKVFQDNAVLQYSKELTFAQTVQVMSDVVCQVTPSVGAWFKNHRQQLSVTRQALYEKLKHTDLPVAAALVRYSADTLMPCLQALPSQPPPLLANHRARVLDGNHLAGTEHRIFETRPFRAAVMPGQALVFFDPRYGLMDAVVLCKDAHAQERSLLDQALAEIAKRDCIIADRNFCTTGFFFGLHRREACFVIRQHKSTLHYELQGERREVGPDRHGRKIYEQEMCLHDPATKETLVIRRVTIALSKPTETGDMEIHILTNLPAEEADALKVAELYAERWTIEGGFQQLTVDLRCEINTLGYPEAALFGFCVAVVAYNVVAMVKNTLSAVWGKEFVKEELSMYYLTLEVVQVTFGLRIAVPSDVWATFRAMSVLEFTDALQEMAKKMQKHKYTKHKRGPKKKAPMKLSGKRHHHQSTAKLIGKRKQL